MDALWVSKIMSLNADSVTEGVVPFHALAEGANLLVASRCRRRQESPFVPEEECILRLTTRPLSTTSMMLQVRGALP